MPKTILDKMARERLVERIQKLTPASSRLWGSMSVNGMLCHVADAMEQGLGRRSDRDKSNLFMRTVLKTLVIYVLPMVKGAPTSEKMDPSREGTRPHDLEHDRNRVLSLLDESGHWPADKPMADHPAFGPLTNAQRGRLTWKHLDYHLRQFGA
jgi:hypothetical protein